MITADEARRKALLVPDVDEALAHANKAILRAVYDGEFNKEMRGPPWDAPCELLEALTGELRALGFRVSFTGAGTLIDWEKHSDD